MPGPRAGYRSVIVRVHDEHLGTDVERSAADVASPTVHRRCQNGSDCTGSGCRIRTGKTSGELATVVRINRQHAERERAENAARAAAIHAAAGRMLGNAA